VSNQRGALHCEPVRGHGWRLIRATWTRNSVARRGCWSWSQSWSERRRRLRSRLRCVASLGTCAPARAFARMQRHRSVMSSARCRVGETYTGWMGTVMGARARRCRRELCLTTSTPSARVMMRWLAAPPGSTRCDPVRRERRKLSALCCDRAANGGGNVDRLDGSLRPTPRGSETQSGGAAARPLSPAHADRPRRDPPAKGWEG